MTDNLIGEKLGNYRLERLIGRGRTGVVYLARDEALLRPTAVKILSWTIPSTGNKHPESWFLSEARNAARINHPNVVQIYAVARHGTHCYIAMEFVEGGSIDIWLKQHGTLSTRRATEVLAQAADALQAAHDAAVIHRDIKPENLLFRSDGTVKLGDFGMALDVTHTRTGSSERAGTPFYTAPEIWQGASASAASDIYALGATYFYLLVGHPPFYARELSALIDAHIRAPLPELPQALASANPECVTLLRRCLAKQPRQRFSTASELAAAARAMLAVAQDGNTTPPPSPPSAREGNPSSSRSLPPQTSGYERGLFVLEPGAPRPYVGEPHLSTRTRLQSLLASGASRAVVLVGRSGTGRTTLVEDAVSVQLPNTRAIRVSAAEAGPTVQLPSALLTALGGPTTGDERALSEFCAGLPANVAPTVVLLDDCEAPVMRTPAMATVLKIASEHHALLPVIVTNPQGAEELTRQFPGAPFWENLTLRALTAKEGTEYVQSWMMHCSSKNGTPAIWTPDALLLVSYASAGVLRSINRICLAVLREANERHKRVIDSWDVWKVCNSTASSLSAKRPASWPLPEVVELLNSLRDISGLPTLQGREKPKP